MSPQQPRDWNLESVVARIERELAGTARTNGGRMAFAGITSQEWAVLRQHLPLAQPEGELADA